ncbi:hypothetical protein J1N35_031986 [Gossypium stocksii]|uniref:Uncharacterized protein n=1 Tax=Gossypium stocksii TaxID=47602 RepID=A0A9D3ZW98_9ROSI|nr:hypothetical protein J1N35_031986 [Gossypium stocksii]
MLARHSALAGATNLVLGLALSSHSIFLAVTVSRYNRNRILGLNDESSQWVSNPEEMLQVADDRVLRMVKQKVTLSMNDDRVLRMVKQKVTLSMNDDLLKPFTKDDIWLVVKAMAPLNAPSIDGFPAIFF